MIIPRYQLITEEDWNYLDTLGVNRYNPVTEGDDLDYEVVQQEWLDSLYPEGVE